MRLPKALFLLLRINDAACYISFLKSFEQKLGLKDRNPQIVPAFPWWRWGVGGGTGEWKEGRKKENWTLINSWAYPPFLFSFALPWASSCSPKAFRPGGAEAVMSVLEAWGQSSAFPRPPRSQLTWVCREPSKTWNSALFPLGFSLFSAVSILTWEMPWTEEPGRLPSLGATELQMAETN